MGRGSPLHSLEVMVKRYRFILVTAAMVAHNMPAFAGPPSGTAIDQDSACALLKTRIAQMDSLPDTGPVGMGWFCDFATFDDRRDEQWFLIALRSNRVCNGVCSNLMGWYAVDRLNSSIHDVDIEDFSPGDEVTP